MSNEETIGMIKVEDAISNLKNQILRFAEGTEPDLALKMAIEALQERKQCNWKAITKRPMTDEERADWEERLGCDIEDEEAVIFENLPEDGKAVLVCTRYGYIYIDTLFSDYQGCFFEDAGDMESVIAWMPLPKPYKEGDK